MIAPEQDLLDRFYRVLVREIRKRKPEYLSEAFTVAEIYQDLVPYHTHRDMIGVRMNGDYEDALLRLLAGEGERLNLESDAARRDFLNELKNAEPNTGIYRDFAAVNVRLNPEQLPDAEDFDDDEVSMSADDEKETVDEGKSEVEAESATVDSEAADEQGGAADSGASDSSSAPGEDTPRFLPDPATVDKKRGGKGAKSDGASGAQSETSANSSKGGPCAWCGEELPDRPDLLFCPHCGGDSRFVPCASCGTDLEPGWGFCVACGERVN